MFSKLSAWAKVNKFAFLLIVFLLAFLIYREVSGTLNLLRGVGQEDSSVGIGGFAEQGFIPSDKGGISTSEDRLVVEESNLSLVVLDVPQAADEIVSFAQREGGFLVSSSLEKSEDYPFAKVVVRVPAAKLRSAVEYFHSLAVEVVSETLMGTDVTKEYEDLDARIQTLQTTIARFEEIRAKATKIADLLEVTREIINLQEQIDALKGQKQYLSDSAKFSRITVYLGTDEFALPYQPEGFRPDVIFKQAVRSVVSLFYGAANAAIWVGVYAVIWLPILVIILYFSKKRRK
ncbi:MAG: DUF4349 domain-containing protein [candidate division WWE3 bacterium]|nr:DUF4349 domain-containing protein [candidate division WWE3 bacterium]